MKRIRFFLLKMKVAIVPLCMLLVGLTGGLASGKTTIAKAFQQLGAHVIDADVLARQVVEPGNPAWKDIVKCFGKAILRKDGTLDREALAELAFKKRANLRRLQDIIHPRVARAQARHTRAIAAQDPKAIIIYDAAMLIEAGAHKRMDRVIVVDTDRATQIRRACRRGNMTKNQARLRIEQQLPLSKKRQDADYVIKGTLPPKKLRETVRKLYQEFTLLAKRRHAVD